MGLVTARAGINSVKRNVVKKKRCRRVPELDVWLKQILVRDNFLPNPFHSRCDYMHTP